MIELEKNIGNCDKKSDCLFSVYLKYPEIPFYEIRQDYDYIVKLINKYFIKIELDEIEEGCLILFKFTNGFHFGIYNKNNEFFHSCNKHKLRLTDLNHYKKYIIGVYKRWPI